MIVQPWIDPRDKDYTDSLNPLVTPGWKNENNPFVRAALDDVFMMALRNAKNIEPRVYTGPDPMNNSVAPGSTQDYEVPAEPNFWLYAMTLSGDKSDFLVNVTDSVTGSTLFSQPCSAQAINAQTHGTANRGPLFFLSTPHLYASPGYPIVRVINTDANAQVCRVNLFGSVEYDL